ncbi:MAG: hypothetical protein GY792_15735 [Gammaproteobacteria bacterium]|nr:hypothetical protein [Gammaproteobacteria bacterium]
MFRKHTRPSYRDHQGDPVRRLLAAVVLMAIRDCSPGRKVSPEDRESAVRFLAGEEGPAWLDIFGIPDRKARAFATNGYKIGDEGAWHYG